jgi:hypothetical protein
MLAGTATAVIWVYLIWFPSGDLTISGVSIIVAGLMGLMGLFAAIASVKGHAPVVFVVFVASFLPVGAMLLSVEHWLRFVGILDILMLLAAVLIWAGSRKKRA